MLTLWLRCRGGRGGFWLLFLESVKKAFLFLRWFLWWTRWWWLFYWRRRLSYHWRWSLCICWRHIRHRGGPNYSSPASHHSASSSSPSDHTAPSAHHAASPDHAASLYSTTSCSTPASHHATHHATSVTSETRKSTTKPWNIWNLRSFLIQVEWNPKVQCSTIIVLRRLHGSDFIRSIVINEVMVRYRKMVFKDYLF